MRKGLAAHVIGEELEYLRQHIGILIDSALKGP
jgi:hypothetical protein